ncbi:SWI/SNF chromatin-remodeling complex subunit [Globomyces sp. JEL0801]|nr:SWI/SNF chromatin-remodeling complex subunit [Globomyces sp. JEL0801]
MQAAEKKLTMVPIRIDVETDGVKWRDTFTWNLNEAIITPDQFAKALCDDVALTPLLIPLISAQIKEQLEDYRNHAPELIGTDETATRGNDSIDDGEKDLAELRIIIKFEWDMACRRNNPELFADTLVSELGLYPEFKTAIAHSIREQIHSAKKSLLVANHDFGTGQIKDENVAAMFLPPLGSTVKRTAKEINEFGPFFSVASATEIEKMEKDLERETR